MILALLTSTSFANPIINQVTHGSATISSSGKTLEINQTSNKAIINWHSFNINANETTRFNQPTNGMTLNRVDAVNGISTIFGQLTANGKIILINPAGIYFGPNAYVSVGSIIASTSNMTDKNFLAGQYIFDQASPSHGTVVNRGQIIAAENGLVALVGSNVSNEGKIQAHVGHVILASGNKFTIDMRGDDLIHFSIDEASTGSGVNPEGKKMRTGVNNSGIIIANGGTVILSAQSARHVVDRSINMNGYIEANSVSQKNGSIILSAGSQGKVRIAGKILASGSHGGKIKIFGNKIKIKSTAVIDASGELSGGEILIGGDYQGKGSGYNSAQTAVQKGANIRADAISKGDGGKIIIWSDKQTHFAGSVSAKGGSLGGNGGFVEISSHGHLDFTGDVNLSAARGVTGTLLLDPENLTIQATGSTTAEASGSPTNTYIGNVDNSILTVSDLQNALVNANVLVLTGSNGNQLGDINVADNITWNTNHSLTLSAYHSINLANNVIISNSGGASINLLADNVGNGSGTVNFSAGSGIALSGGGAVTIYYNPINYATPTNYNTFVTGAIPTAYMLVSSGGQLQNINTNLSGDYALAKDITMSGNFTPLGSSSTPYTGIFDGQNHTIDQLTIVDATPNGNIGLFGYTANATIRNLALTNVTITETANAASIGSVIGDAENTIIANIFSNAFIQVNTNNLGRNMYIGGLIGVSNNSSVSNTIANVPSLEINGTNYGTVGGNGRVSIGGLIGNVSGGSVVNSGSLEGIINTNLNAISATNQSARNSIGGLIGGVSNSALINNTFSTTSITHVGDVHATDGTAQTNIGGLVGRSDTGALISNSYSAGLIQVSSLLSVPTTGSGYVFTGGLVGNLSVANTSGIDHSFSLSDISLNATVDNTVSPPSAYFMTGGLVGQANGDIDNSYAKGTITATLTACTGAGGLCTAPASNYAFYVGGVAGDGFSYIRNSYSTGAITVSGNNNNGAVGVGGIIGTHITLYDRGLINLSRSGSINVTMNNTNGGQLYVGGIAGSIVYYGTPNPSNPAFDNLYSSSTLNVTAQNNGSYISVGGLIGNNGFNTNDPGGKIDRSLTTGYINPQITNLNAATTYIGGFIGFQDNDPTSSVTSSYWDTDMSGYNQNQGIGNNSGSYPGLTAGCFGGTCSNGGSANLSNQATFTGWDFTTTWNIINNYSFPYLLTANPTPPQVFSGTTNLSGRNSLALVSNGVIIDSVVSTAAGFYYFSESTDTISNNAGLIYIMNNLTPGNIIFMPGVNESLSDLTIITNQVNIVSNQTASLSNNILALLVNGLAGNNYILYSSMGNDLTLGNSLHPSIEFIISPNIQYSLDGSINQLVNANSHILFNDDVSVDANVSLSANTIQFNGNINGLGNSLILNSPNNIIVNGDINLSNLTFNGGNLTLNGATVTTDNSQIYNGNVVINQNMTMVGKGIYINSGITGNYRLSLIGQNGNSYFKLAGNLNVNSIDITGGNLAYRNVLDLSNINGPITVTLETTYSGNAILPAQPNIAFSNLNEIIGNTNYALSNLTVLPNKSNFVLVNSINEILVNDPMTLRWFNLLKSQSGVDIVYFNTPTIYNEATNLLTLNNETVKWLGFNSDYFTGKISFYNDIQPQFVEPDLQVLSSIENWMLHRYKYDQLHNLLIDEISLSQEEWDWLNRVNCYLVKPANRNSFILRFSNNSQCN